MRKYNAMNVLSFSLFGSAPIYRVGMLANLKLAKQFYPDWQVWVYCREIGTELRVALQKEGAWLKDFPCGNAMLARFFAIDEPAVDCMLVKDADSRIGERELGPVKNWIESGIPFHTIRDHPHHIQPFMGGHFGCTKKGLHGTSIRQLTTDFPHTNNKGERDSIYNTDQIFLAEKVWPLAQKRGFLAYDFCGAHLFQDAKLFPARIGDWRFVGERIDADEKPEPGKWEARVNFMQC